MTDTEPQTVILYRNGDQDYITFGDGQPIEVKVVESVPLETQGASQQAHKPALGSTTQYIVVPSEQTYEDSVHFAAQLGRLDLLTLLVAVFALIGFWLFRREAKAVAREVAETEARQETRQLLPNMVPIEVRKSVELLMQNTAQDNEPEAQDPYASAQEDENDQGA